MDDENPYSSPLADTTPVSLPVNRHGAWRDNGLLAVRKGCTLPDLCIKCCRPANGYKLKRNLSWHHPAWFVLLVLCNVLIYVIVALVVRQTGVVFVGLCEAHRARRRNAILIAWTVALAGMGSIVLAVSSANNQVADEVVGIFSVLGFLLILGGLVVGAIFSPTVVPKRIDRDYMWLKRVHRDYLALLPEFGSRMEGTVDEYSTAIDRPAASSPQRAAALYNRALTYAFEAKYDLALADLEALLAMSDAPAALRTKAQDKRQQLRAIGG